MRMTIAEISHALGADPCFSGGPSAPVITGVATDSRAVAPGDIFVCLRGERTDGHAHVGQAVAAGAAAILSERELEAPGVPVWRVDSTVAALGGLASFWRARTRARVVCITGTAGKTTLKDTLGCILAQRGNVAATSGNHNNQIGLPLSILAAAGDEDFWVIELGISHDGDMECLGSVVRPDLGVILNVGAGHMDGLGQKGVAWHKAQLLRHLAPGGLGLVNGCYADLAAECEKLGEAVEYFGRPADPFHIVRDFGNGVYEMGLKERTASFHTPFHGSYAWEVALAAASAACLAGIDDQAIEQGFRKAHLPRGRFQLSVYGNFFIYDDTYNANPLSMRAMLEAAAEKARKSGLPLVAVLGEMRELGPVSAECHYRLGVQLAALEPAAVFWKGGHETDVRNGLAAGGSAKIPFYSAGSVDCFAPQFDDFTHDLAGAVVLMKGSRSNRLEEYLEAIRPTLAARENVNVL